MTNNQRPSFMMTEASSAVDATTIGGKVELNWKRLVKLIYILELILCISLEMVVENV
jgi:hypothetical protein